ncbi:plasmid replication protein RepB (plasmid) [Clostridium aceticum]|uniref:Plasmid replication protein RepB n=1 Tax=Clostridium aceticum TaxID=84022 RepID=A0A0G3WIP7_9CLOT|nr:protein rep [Clostridium aceticum]AKL97374.1 plasmid replication protein RepB [Clostridium aceticum]
MDEKILKDVRVSKNHLQSVHNNNQYNKLIVGYYNQYIEDSRPVKKKKTILDYTRFTYEDYFVEKLEHKRDKLANCNKKWEVEVYEKLKVKDYVSTLLCNDKFCSNCKKVKQASRMAKNMPLLEQYKDKLYQMVLTTPNIVDHTGEELKKEIKKQFKALTYLTEYLKGKKQVKGLDFDIGYLGAIRSLEVTYSGDYYHPHLHLILVLDNQNEFITDKKNINNYSYDYYKKRPTRLFSDFEILLQKSWYLLYNGERLTKENIDKLEKGYSCMMDKAKEDDFLEVFKYMVKNDPAEENVKGSNKMTYKNFRVLEYALHSIRQIQGYGVFYNIKDILMAEEVNEMYEWIREYLIKNEGEAPAYRVEKIQKLLDDTEYTLISRKKIFTYLRKIYSE